MSAKKERELRKGIEVCQMLMERQDEWWKVCVAMAETLDNHKDALETTQELLLTTVRKMEKLEQWRRDHIEQDMLRKERLRKERENVEALLFIRKKHVERVRRLFGWASAGCFLLMLGFTGALEGGTLPFWACVTGQIASCCGGFVCACKAGVMEF